MSSLEVAASVVVATSRFEEYARIGGGAMGKGDRFIFRRKINLSPFPMVLSGHRRIRRIGADPNPSVAVLCLPGLELFGVVRVHEGVGFV